MNDLILPDGFDWDEGNTSKNWKKHKVSFIECEEIFLNNPKWIIEDIKHSTNEKRYSILGRTFLNRLLYMSFTLRKNKIRIITARDMSKKERIIYNEKI